MGMIMSYACRGCGYASGELLLGPSPRPEEFDPVLVACERCKTLRVLDRKRVARGCGRHRKPYVVQDEERVRCPRCSERLTLHNVALWD